MTNATPRAGSQIRRFQVNFGTGDGRLDRAQGTRPAERSGESERLPERSPQPPARTPPVHWGAAEKNWFPRQPDSSGGRALSSS